MNNAQRDIRRKTRALEHAARIANVRKTCHSFSVARSGCYVWKKAYETHGDEGLVDQRPCPYNPRLCTASRTASRFGSYQPFCDPFRLALGFCYPNEYGIY